MKKIFSVLLIFAAMAVLADLANGNVLNIFAFCIFSAFAGFWNGYMDAHTLKSSSILESYLDEKMLWQSEAWRNKHNAKFFGAKSNLVQFTSVWYYSKWWMLMSICFAFFFAFSANINGAYSFVIAISFSYIFGLTKEIARNDLSKNYITLNKILFYPLLISQRYIDNE